MADRRKRAKLTQAELAERVNVSTETISRLERGAVVPSLARLEAVAVALDVELSALFRVIDRASQKDRAMNRLLAVVRRESPGDIDVIADLVERVLGDFRK